MKNKNIQCALGITLMLFGGIIVMAGLGGFGASFVIGADLSTKDVGIAPLDFIANNFRTVCAFQIPIGLLIALFGLFLFRKCPK